MKKNIRRLLTALICCSVLLNLSPVAFASHTSEASNISRALNAADIIEYAGNAEIKKYGLSLENGASAVLNLSTVPDTDGTAYYVDAVDGSDSNNGKTEEEAWKTFKNVNNTFFEPGDRILLKANSVWTEEMLWPKGSGTAEAPIVISAYGTGNLPRIDGKAAIGQAVNLENQEYWDISNLEITNTAEGFSGTQGALLEDVRGVRIAGNNGEVLDGIRIHDIYIHDVTGEICWVSGSSSSDGDGIRFGMGWDGAKRTGGIIVECFEPQDSSKPTIFNNLTIEHNVLNNNSWGGIVIKQWQGDSTGSNEGWCRRGSNYNWAPHTNLVIQDNFLSQASSNYACNTILLISVQDSVIQRNVSKNAGTCGIELDFTDNSIVQYNEVFGTRVKAGGADSNAIDPDRYATNALIQYNYTHDTGDGILLCGFETGSSVVRFNVVQDADKRYVNPHGDSGENYVYSNIFYNTKEKASLPFVASSGGNRYYSDNNNFYSFYNNIFYNAAKTTKTVVYGEGSSMAYGNNCYFGAGNISPASDEKAINADPQFANADIAGAKENVAILENLKLRTTSPLLGDGIVIPSSPNITIDMLAPHDFFRNNVPDSRTIGIAAYAETDSVINGYVKDEYGYSIEDGTVRIVGTDQTVNTDDTGFFAITSLPAGDYTLIPSCKTYNDGEAITITLLPGTVFRQDLVLGESTTDVGSVTGNISNSSGPLEDVLVTLINESTAMSATTDELGNYLITDVPVGSGYYIRAEKEGYQTIEHRDITVRPAGVHTVNITMSKIIGKTEYLLNDSFDNYSVGSFEGNNIWNILNSGCGTITVEESIEGNRYIRINKTSSGNIAMYNVNALGLFGTVTIEARVMRTVEGSNASQLGMYSFRDGGGWNASSPTNSSNPMATFAFTNGNIITHNVRNQGTTVTAKKYDFNTWYIVREIIDLDSGTFDFYVDDMENAVLTDQPLRTAGSEIDFLNFYGNSSNIGDLCIDYVRACEGIAHSYHDTGLASVKVLETTLDGDYRGEVEAECEEVSVEVQASSPFAQVSINGENYDGTSPVIVPVKPGENVIPIIIVAEDGLSSETYNIIIERADPNEQSYLTSLSVDGGTISPKFSKEQYNYFVELNSAGRTTTIHMTKPAAGTAVTITVNGAIVATANSNVQETVPIVLSSGKNTVVLQVNSVDGADWRTYTLEVYIADAVTILNDAFEDYLAGTFTGNDTWKVVNSGCGAITVEVAEEGNKYIRINKTSTGNLAFHNISPLKMTGIFTIEARVMRTTEGSGASQLGMYSFQSDGGWNASSPTNSTGPIATFAFTRGQIITHNVKNQSTSVNVQKYNLNVWYVIREVVNLDSGTFDIYIDDMDTPILSNQSLRTSGESIDFLNFYGNSSNVGDLCIDYVSVYKGAN